MKRNVLKTLSAALLIVGVMSGELLGQTAATWDGGNGDFNDPKWNGGMTAEELFGNTRIENGAWDVTIGDGSTVTYTADNDTNPERTGPGLRPHAEFVDPNLVEGSFTIHEGATLVHTTGPMGDSDGMWTQWDVDTVLDNGTFIRNKVAGTAQAGGLIMFGSWRTFQNQQVDVLITNGGSFQNDGQVWFGADNEHAVGLGVSWEINGGTVDLTGGDLHAVNNDDYLGPGWGDTYSNLAFFYGAQISEGDGQDGSGDPKGENYEINFSGYSGSLTVDTIDAPAPTDYEDEKQGLGFNPQGSGIRIYRTDAAGDTTETKATYQNLWDEGILKAKGMTGGYYDSGVLVSTEMNFDSFFTVTGTEASDNYTVTPKALTTVTWDGGTGEWNDDAKWNGGQTAQTVLGRMNGNGGGFAIEIDGSKPGGADVSFDPNPDTGVDSDFRMEVGGGLSSMTINNGGEFSINTASDDDGKFTRWGGDLTIDGEGSEFRRTKSGPSFSGGALMFGAFSQRFGQEVDVNITNGGLFDNDGELYFGGDGGQNAAGLEVTVTIDGGSMNLHGGDAINPATDTSGTPGDGFGFDGGTGEDGSNDLEIEMNLNVNGFFTAPVAASPSVLFMYTLRSEVEEDTGPLGLANEKYAINFTGSGSMTVDHAGIYVASQEGDPLDPNFGLFTMVPKTYEELWADGILQANGLSGLDGATFGDFFSVTGAHLSDGYTLTSLIAAPGLAGDYNGDSVVDAADYTVWRDNLGTNNNLGGNGDETGASAGVVDAADYAFWKTNFGNTAGAGSALGAGGAVPEPGSLLLVLVALVAGAAVRRTRR